MKVITMWLESWVSHWLSMICGFIGVITFCLYSPSWDFCFIIYKAKRRIKNRQTKKGIKNGNNS